MYFHKIDHPFNFAPVDLSGNCLEPIIEACGPDCWRIRVERPGQSTMADQLDLLAGLEHADSPDPQYSLAIDSGGIAICHMQSNKTVLTSHQLVPFGVCASKWLFSFTLEEGMRFYGMGEKNIGFEKSGVRTKFWNTDVWADFSGHDIESGTTDPMYASFPVLLVKTSSTWVGMMVPTSVPVFMDTGTRQTIEGVKDADEGSRFFYLGAVDGNPDLIITSAATVASVVRRLTMCLGRPALMPVWALGHHQSRWGYGSLEDVRHLDGMFVEHDIPCDAIWFDIDYMDGYRVFTTRVQRRDDERLHTRKLVAILDPAVKADSYEAAERGRASDVFCYNRQGLPYVGFVWPGASWFPDFSLIETRQWWADETANLTTNGFDGFWIDMNDPSTGSVEVEEMLFGRGKIEHHMLHNWYALGMAQATYEGLKRAYPDRRPFVLTRSAMLSSHRWGAMWTGDSVSNYHHLRKTIEMVLSLSLSTMAFVGADIGGFGGDCDGELLRDWYRACALFPVLRNHSADSTHRQEPWQFGGEVATDIRSVLRLRYALLPYLYNLMYKLHEYGDPPIRAMLYAFGDERFDEEESQFMIGDALLQAPKLERGQISRNVAIPEGRWLDLNTLEVVTGPGDVTANLVDTPMPLYLREGCFLPVAKLPPTALHTSADIDLSRPSFLFFPPASGVVHEEYLYDSGDGYALPHVMKLSVSCIRDTLHCCRDGREFSLQVHEGHSLCIIDEDGVRWCDRSGMHASSPLLFQ